LGTGGLKHAKEDEYGFSFNVQENKSVEAHVEKERDIKIRKLCIKAMGRLRNGRSIDCPMRRSQGRQPSPVNDASHSSIATLLRVHAYLRFLVFDISKSGLKSILP